MKSVINAVFKSTLCLVLCLATLLSVISPSGIAKAFEVTKTDNGYSYIISSDSSGEYATITDYTGSDEVLRIPSSLGGCAVKYIRSLISAMSVRAVIVPHGVVGIGVIGNECSEISSGAVIFESVELNELQLSDTVEYIGDYAFYHCKRLRTVNFEAATALREIGTGAFMKCRVLNNITAPAGLDSIGDSAFSGCKKLTNIKLNEALTSIGDKAFAYSGLKSFYIPSGVTRFGELGSSGTDTTHKRSVLHACKKLRKVTVSSDNKLLSSKDGILFSKDGSLLCFYPPAKKGSTYKVPSKVKEICDFAFNYTANLTNVIISTNSTKTNEWTFYRCQNIDSPFYAIGPITIGSYANDTSLKSVRSHSDGKRIDTCTQTKSRRDNKTGAVQTQSTEKRTFNECNQKERKPDIPRKTFEKTKIVLLI